MKPFNQKITPKSFLSAYCKLSIPHTKMGLSRHKAIGKRKFAFSEDFGASSLFFRAGIAIFKCSSVFTNFQQGRPDPRSFGASIQSKNICFSLGISGSFLFQIFRALGLFVLNLAKLLPLPTHINWNFILQK